MADDLPDEFDLIVIGTGFPESCVAAAASRIGKTVLHIDPNDHYGGAWASFSLETFIAHLERGNNVELLNASQQWHLVEAESNSETEAQAQQQMQAGTDVPAVNADSATSDSTKTKDVERWTKAELLAQSRRFNIDLCPKILYAAGRLVQLLISSNICRYAEFRAVDRVCTLFHNAILTVPCSRSDVFNTKDLSIVEKRLLMKFLTICMSYGEDKYEEDTALYRGKTFREYLQAQKVTDKISTCVMQAIAMCNDDTTFEEGMARTQHFLSSLGRYGNTPFLFPMHGCGEIPQCFCRLCAVFGGIYCLKRSITDISVDADTNDATVLVEGKSIRTKHVVSTHGHLPASVMQRNLGIFGQGALVNRLSRGVFIASTTLGDDELNSGGGGVNLLRLLAAGNKEAILIQLSHYSGTCPKDLYLFHITTAAQSHQPAVDLEPFTTQIFNGQPNAPKLLYSAYFTLSGRERTAACSPIDTNTPIYCTSAPYYELDYDLSIANALDIFSKMYAEAEFLPRAPDPEEIVVDGEDPRALSENSLPDDLREQLRELEKSAEQMEIEDDGSAAKTIAAQQQQQQKEGQAQSEMDAE